MNPKFQFQKLLIQYIFFGYNTFSLGTIHSFWIQYIFFLNNTFSLDLARLFKLIQVSKQVLWSINNHKTRHSIFQFLKSSLAKETQYVNLVCREVQFEGGRLGAPKNSSFHAPLAIGPFCGWWAKFANNRGIARSESTWTLLRNSLSPTSSSSSMFLRSVMND